MSSLFFYFYIIFLFIFVTIHTNLWKNVAMVLYVYYNSMYSLKIILIIQSACNSNNEKHGCGCCVSDNVKLSECFSTTHQ